MDMFGKIHVDGISFSFDSISICGLFNAKVFVGLYWVGFGKDDLKFVFGY